MMREWGTSVGLRLGIIQGVSNGYDGYGTGRRSPVWYMVRRRKTGYGDGYDGYG
jgi:hypothetical protein